MLRFPAWIKKYPDASSREVLRQIYLNGPDSFETQREVVFVITNVEMLTELKKEIQEAGWSTHIVRRHNNVVALECSREEYVLRAKCLLEDESFFAQVAVKYGCTYDGWYASV